MSKYLLFRYLQPLIFIKFHFYQVSRLTAAAHNLENMRRKIEVQIIKNPIVVAFVC